MRITSDAFKDGERIPIKYVKKGENKNPPIHLDDVPDRTRSLALVVDDPDAPSGTFNHWIVFNMDPKIHDIKEGRLPAMAALGRNDFDDVDYDGPEPPSGEHHYVFKAYALDTVLPLGEGIKRQELERAMQNHVIESAELTGVFAKA